MTDNKRILIACIGNIFLGDDAFGVEVAKRLAVRRLPDEVSVVDYGIRGIDLAYSLLEGYEVTIFVDATPRGGEPGTLYTIEPDLDGLEHMDQMVVEAHGLDPMRALAMAKSMGVEFKRILLVGCEPATFGSEEEGQMGLSEPVEAAVDEAVRIIESLVTGILEADRRQALPLKAI